MAYQHILDREGQRVQINDDKLWRDLFGVAKNVCYGMGYLIEEITTSEYSHCQSQQSTSTIQQSVASIPLKIMSMLEFLEEAYEEQKQHTKFLEKAYEEQKQQNQYILSLLESWVFR